MHRPRASLLVLGFLAPLAGCTTSLDGSTTTTTTTPVVDTTIPTTITVQPSGFLGKVSCSNLGGAMQSYVATLIDTTTEKYFELPSSVPTSCSQPIAFRYVASGRSYSARIEGYDRPATELAARGGPSTGSSTVVLAKDQSVVVSPRWSNDTGDPEKVPCTAVTASDSENVDIAECDPVVQNGSAGATGIIVDPRGSLGLLACADPATKIGSITGFDVHPQSAALPGKLGLVCDPTAHADLQQVTYTTGVQDGITYTFTVDAYEAGGGPAAYTATCSAKARAGLIVVATCAPLF